MLVYLDVTAQGRRRKSLTASFHNVSPQKPDFSKPFKTIAGNATKVTADVMHELDTSSVPIKFFHFSSNLPKDVSSILHRAIMSHLRANLPVKRGLLKVSWDKKDPDNVDVVHYASINDEQPGKLSDVELGCFSGPLLNVARDVFQGLDEGYRHPVGLVFDSKVSDEVRELFCTIVSIYNKQLTPPKCLPNLT